MSVPLSIRLLERIADMAQPEWDGLLAPDSSPFVEWAWLEALERTGCAAQERGWLPRHLTVYRGEKLIGAAPAYIKGNSEGEFVFDWQWAGLAERRLGLRYYPKLLLAVPFTPATGDRILVAPGEDPELVRAAVAEGSKQLCEQLELSSAHLNFPREAEQQAFVKRGWLERYGLQFQWFNQGFATFEDFLATLPSKKRTQIRRERKEVRAQGITVETRSGDALDDRTMDAAYRFYLSTVDKFAWGRRYLNEAFFKLIRDRWSKNGQLEIVVAREGENLVAGAINIRKGDRLYGRYWGGEERRFLHFEVCYYHSIDEAIARKLVAFEPGAGGEHKHARGFKATLTRSAHHLRDPRMRRVIADFCADEAAYLRKVVAGEVEPED
ncbi:MAG: GNAT family N-acetyltransferase [Polyangiales bacterium]